MASVEMFDHTADVGLRVSAESLNALFQIAAEALFDYIVVNRCDVAEDLVEVVNLDAESPADLLAKWLNELIFRSETMHRLYTRFDVTVDNECLTLSAEIRGEAMDLDRHILDHEVKAVTQHGLALMRTETGWIAELILDI